MVAERAASAHEDTNAALAPRWHTAALVALLLTVATTGTLLQHYGAPSGAVVVPRVSPGSRILAQYAPIFAVNWALVLYCCVLFRRHNALPELLGERWATGARALGDVALALASFVGILCVQVASARLFPMGRNAATAALLPSTGAERLTWVIVAATVGFCEEVVFRGYLQTQLSAFTRSRAGGVGLQALLFGVAHLDQGPGQAARVAGYGLLFGVLAQARRSLRPGILCHVLVDLAAAFVR